LSTSKETFILNKKVTQTLVSCKKLNGICTCHCIRFDLLQETKDPVRLNLLTCQVKVGTSTAMLIVEHMFTKCVCLESEINMGIYIVEDFNQLELFDASSNSL
jgi:hypothetical protein